MIFIIGTALVTKKSMTATTTTSFFTQLDCHHRPIRVSHETGVVEDKYEG